MALSNNYRLLLTSQQKRKLGGMHFLIEVHSTYKEFLPKNLNPDCGHASTSHRSCKDKGTCVKSPQGCCQQKPGSGKRHGINSLAVFNKLQGGGKRNRVGAYQMKEIY